MSKIKYAHKLHGDWSLVIDKITDDVVSGYVRNTFAYTWVAYGDASDIAYDDTSVPPEVKREVATVVRDIYKTIKKVRLYNLEVSKL